jgi:hypothetical protein
VIFLTLSVRRASRPPDGWKVMRKWGADRHRATAAFGAMGSGRTPDDRAKQESAPRFKRRSCRSGNSVIIPTSATNSINKFD